MNKLKYLLCFLTLLSINNFKNSYCGKTMKTWLHIPQPSVQDLLHAYPILKFKAYLKMIKEDYTLLEKAINLFHQDPTLENIKEVRKHLSVLESYSIMLSKQLDLYPDLNNNVEGMNSMIELTRKIRTITDPIMPKLKELESTNLL